MKWKAVVEGHQFDLETLADHFPASGDPAVTKEADGLYHLSASDLGIGDSPDHMAAGTLIKRLNGIGRALDSGFEPVALSGRYTDPSGNVNVVVGEVAAFRGRGRLSVGQVLVNGQPVPPVAPKGPRYTALAARDRNVALALRVLGQADDLDWYDLYKAYEVVEKDVGGDKEVSARGWASKADLNRLTASANHPALSGDDARHAVMSGTPAADKAMPLNEGRALVQRMVASWIEAHPDF